jgi:phage baseplate assembly protein V
MIRRGIVVAVDEKTGKVRVQMPDLGIVSNWLPVLHQKTHLDKSYWLPDIGEYVIIAYDEEGEHSDGYVLGAIYNEADNPPVASKDKYFIRFSDGTEIEYDRQQHQLRINVNGDITIEASGNITIKGSRIDLNP